MLTSLRRLALNERFAPSLNALASSSFEVAALGLELRLRHASTAELPLPQPPQTNPATPGRQDGEDNAASGPDMVILMLLITK